MPRLIKKCVTCGKLAEHYGLGKCQRCYNRAYHREVYRKKHNVAKDRQRKVIE